MSRRPEVETKAPRVLEEALDGFGDCGVVLDRGPPVEALVVIRLVEQLAYAQGKGQKTLFGDGSVQGGKFWGSVIRPSQARAHAQASEVERHNIGSH